MGKMCYACGGPVAGPGGAAQESVYCQHCTDDEGQLRSREEIHAGIARWIRSWQEGITEEQAHARAALYMRAMPAWAED